MLYGNLENFQENCFYEIRMDTSYDQMYSKSVRMFN